MDLLKGKTALITGAARGIGKAIALKFAEEGANIAFTDLVIDENGKATEAEIAAKGVKAKGYASNAADYAQTEEVVKQGTPGYAEAVKRDLQLNDFAATLLLTIALPIENSDETFIVTCQVGDGMTAAIRRTAPYDQIITLLGDADSGAFSGETEFLTSSSIDSLQSLMGRTRVSRKKIDIIMSMTDGVADDYDPNGKEMLRLYLDLLVNRVISSPKLEMMQKKLDKARYEELSKIVPAPQSYPAVTGEIEPRMVPVQYVRELQEKQGLDLKKIWEEGRESLTVMAGAIQLNTGKNAATRLKEWLDSYVVRGSFDDRTLVILQRGE